MLELKNVKVEHQSAPLGLDVTNPRFGWELVSDEQNVIQTAYLIRISDENAVIADTGRIESQSSIENTVCGLCLSPMTEYRVEVTVWDNKGNMASRRTCFETGRMNAGWHTCWVEPEQIPTDPYKKRKLTHETACINPWKGQLRDFAEFMPVQYIRIPCRADKPIKRARIYATAHGVYRLEVNGIRPDDRELAPEVTAYKKYLQYQTYDITALLHQGDNMITVTLADGWWAGRIGFTGDCCQYGNKTGLLLEADLLYEDGTCAIVTGEDGVSSGNGPLIFSDIFVGEKYDAGKELTGWHLPEYDDQGWTKMKPTDEPLDNLIGQYGEPVHPILVLDPADILTTPNGETVLDMGQVIAGQLEFTLEAPAGCVIKLEHSEILDRYGNFYCNITGPNKEQTDIYITKMGIQTYRPSFTFHGFRYVRISGWPGTISPVQFKAYILSSEMEQTGSFETSDERLNRLQKNIWWSQVANTISIPTDCPQRERAGWGGDIMVFSPTMCFNRNADAFLTRWMNNVRAEQFENGLVPLIVPYFPSYKSVADMFGSETSCGWGDAVVLVPWSVYQAYGDRQILADNYAAMKQWMNYVADRVENHHPDGYEAWDDARRERSKLLWNTDFHYGDWLIPSLVLNDTDGTESFRSALDTKAVVAPAYYALVSDCMAKIAHVLGKKSDAEKYKKQHEAIRKAFIEEYIREDGSIEGDFQGLYVLALKHNLVPDEIRPKMINRLCKMIQENNGCLDTGFLSVLFIMDALCENGRRDMAYSLLYQNKCPSWLYEVEKGATTMWESWGAVLEDGRVGPYSFNHYAFGCIGDWMYRELGGIQILEPGYKKIKIAPALDCGLEMVKASEHTPYGIVRVEWRLSGNAWSADITIPANTTAEIILPGMQAVDIGSGTYAYTGKLETTK